jgi:hypothetical protein
MGFFDFITSGTKAAENATEIGKTLTNGVVSGLDALILTEEEKLQYSAEGGKLYLDFWKTFGTENSAQSKARRDLAVMTFKVYFALILLSLPVYLVSPDLASYIKGYIVSLSGLVMLVAGAYFIPYQISKVYTNKKD